MSETRRSSNILDLPLDALPDLELGQLCRRAQTACAHGARVSSYFAMPDLAGKGHELVLVLAHDATRELSALRSALPRGEALPSLTPALPQVQAFEREIHEQWGIPLDGHPWLKPLRAHGAGAPHDFFQIEGEGMHEVAVGPVHAGVIEPGHFRFQCHGEKVLSLEIRLGYQHRGLEALLLRSTAPRRMVLAESVAGDTAIGHGTACCLVSEGLAGLTGSPAVERIRAIALELERLANHVGDLAALCSDVAYLPGASYFGRIRARFLNLLILLSGNRFGRGLLTPGGLNHGLTPAMAETFLERLTEDERDLRSVAELTFDSSSVLSRFEGTGVVSRKLAVDLGLVGVVARASGLARDVRHDHPTAIHRRHPIPLSIAKSGDVMARARVRWLEVQRSLRFLRGLLKDGMEGPLHRPLSPSRPHRLVVALVEGWRGEIAHAAVTDGAGRLRIHKIVDPSFHNWFGLAMALRGNQISDFPLCNKSFNLSYAGHDL